jgi:peptide-methionine (S)-S-oxide reductase
MDTKREEATFAAGCFWGVEAAFRELPGVVDTMVGYTGGHTEHPTYEDVCSHTTGHAEAVQVRYDPTKISYEQLLHAFWEMHDPTQKGGQGLDIGDNYRSAIFYHTDTQRAAAEAAKAAEQGMKRYGGRTIVTEIAPASTFWRAEEYHQRYFEKTGRRVCH